MDSLEEFIEDSIDSHGLVDRNAGQSSLSNKQLYLMLNTLITNQSAALNAEFKRLHERLDKIEKPTGGYSEEEIERLRRAIIRTPKEVEQFRRDKEAFEGEK